MYYIYIYISYWYSRDSDEWIGWEDYSLVSLGKGGGGGIIFVQIIRQPVANCPGLNIQFQTPGIGSSHAPVFIVLIHVVLVWIWWWHRVALKNVRALLSSSSSIRHASRFGGAEPKLKGIDPSERYPRQNMGVGWGCSRLSARGGRIEGWWWNPLEEVEVVDFRRFVVFWWLEDWSCRFLAPRAAGPPGLNLALTLK